MRHFWLFSLASSSTSIAFALQVIMQIPHIIHSFVQQLFINVLNSKNTVWTEDMGPAPKIPL